jgi:hypothetical protein
VLNLNISVLGWNCMALYRFESVVLVHTTKNLRFYKRRVISWVAALWTFSEGFGCAELINYRCNCRKTQKTFNTIRKKSKLESKSKSF